MILKHKDVYDMLTINGSFNYLIKAVLFCLISIVFVEILTKIKGYFSKIGKVKLN